MIKSTSTVALALLLTAAGSTFTAKADSVVYSSFGGTALTGAPEAQPASFTAGNFTIGNPNGTVAAPVSTTSASSGYTQVNGTAASGTYNIGNAVLTGSFSALSSYFSVTLTPTSGNQIQLSDFDFGTRSTGSGPQAYALYTSADNFTTALFTGTVANNSTWTFNNNTITAPVSGAVSTPLEIRLYAYGGSGTATANTINSRLDDITVTASSITAANVPEPATYAYVLAGLGGLALATRRRRVA